MAKKITVDEEQVNVPDESITPMSSPIQPASGQTNGISDPPENPEFPEEPQLNLVTEGVLKVYTNYEKLYIDSQGGTFTLSTPENLRKGATLFNNPFYNQ